MMKKFLSVVAVLCLVAIILPSTAALATESDTAISEVSLEEEGVTTDAEPFDFSQPITVGHYEYLTDIVLDMDSSNKKGYGYEVFKKIEETSDLEFEFVEMENTLFDAAESDDIDVFGLYIRTDERRENLLFSKAPFSKTYALLTSKDMDIVYADFAEIDGKTVATYPDSYAQADFDKICEMYDISVEYVYGESYNYTELDTDLQLMYSSTRDIEDLNNILNIGVYNLYLVTNPENVELMTAIDNAFMEVVIGEGNFFWELEEKYLGNNLSITHRGLAPAEIAKLQERPLEVGYVSHYRPISYTNLEGQADGAMVDTLNLFAQLYGFEVNYHPYSLNDPPETRNNFDILLTLYGDGVYDKEYYSLSDAYYELPMYAQVNLDLFSEMDTLEELLESGITIGSLKYQTVDFSEFTGTFQDTEMVFSDEWIELLDEFAAGRIDMLVSTETAATYAELYLDDESRATLHTNTVIPMHLYINKEISETYLPIFNVLMDNVSQIEYETILEVNGNEFLPSNETSFLEFLFKNWYFFVLALFIIAGGFVALYFRGQIEKREALLKSYNTDPLTGLMANQKFRETVEEKISNAKPDEYEIISFDIDMFKTMNTHFSNERGTTVIIAIADAIKKAFEGTNAVICRRIADEFLIFRRVNDGGTINQIFKTDILPAIEDNISEKYKVTLSFGNVIVNDVKAKATALIGQADSARAAGKSSHKTTFITFDEKMKKKYEDKVNITFRMEQALKDREFYVEYQPKIDFNTLTLSGAEALVRWAPRLGNKIYPDEFIPVFEENGFISYLDLFVLEEVCKCIKSNCAIMDIPRISVNLSSHTVLTENIVSRVSDILSLYDISKEMIELEITESAVEANTVQFLSTIKRFKKLGFAVSIDDFGAGVSSLNRLSSIEADVLKLDKAFFDLKGQGGNSTVVVADVINMAKHLKMKVVAEGVETASQAVWLKGIGCDYAQGYFFAKPMSVEDFKALLIEKKQFSISLT